MNEFENKLIHGIYVSRYVASWSIAGGSLKKGFLFKEWLRTLTINGENLTEDEIQYIHAFAENGKLELQELAKEFLKGA